MSDTLTASAPAAGVEAPSVEVDAPDPFSGEVEDGSGSQPEGELIPKARFDGLMSTFNRKQTEFQRALQEREAEVESLRSKLAERETEPVSTTSPNPLEERVNTLTELLMEERLEGARRRALDEFPAAKPFADLIVANTPEDIREMARILSERVQGVAAPAATTETVTTTVEGEPAGEAQTEQSPTATTVETTVPVVGGGTSFNEEAPVSERITEAIGKRDFQAWLHAKREQQAMQGVGDDRQLEG